MFHDALHLVFFLFTLNIKLKTHLRLLTPQLTCDSTNLERKTPKPPQSSYKASSVDFSFFCRWRCRWWYPEKKQALMCGKEKRQSVNKKYRLTRLSCYLCLFFSEFFLWGLSNLSSMYKKGAKCWAMFNISCQQCTAATYKHPLI